MKNKILIAGGTGFIGYHLAKKFLKRKFEVTSLSLSKPKKERYLKNVKYLYCDISNLKSLKKVLVEEFNYVVNLAGHVDHTNKRKVINSHFIGCKNLVYIFRKKKIKIFIQIGSSVEYGRKNSPQNEKKKIKLNSIQSNYGKAKLMSTNYLLNLYKKKKFPVIILRLYLIYGAKQDKNRLVPIVINSCLKNKKFPCSIGTQKRDFLHVDDLISLFIKIINSKKNYFGNIFNVGFGKPFSVKKVILLIKKISNGGYPEFGKIAFRKDEILNLYPNINKVKNYFNWKPKTSLKNGLVSLIKNGR